MKLKNFDDYLKTRLTKKEIAEIEKQAQREKKLLETWQANISQSIHDYMEQKNIGFNDLVRMLNVSPTQVAKIQKGQANLTLATMAHIFSTLNQQPQFVFKKK